MRTLILVILSLMITTIACTQNGAPHPEEVNVEYTPKHINLIRPIVEPEKIYRMHLWNSRYNYLPEEMSKMRNLRRLALDNVEVKDWERSSKAISSFKNLEVLEIYSELPFLPFNPTNLKSLEKLNLMGSSGYNLEKAITKIEKLENLKVLFIGGLDVIEIPESILKLESLEELDIGYHNEALDYKAALNLISRLPNLKSLSIDMASLTSIDESFKNLRHLNKISFYDCEINLDEFFMLTKGWDNLEELVLEDMSMVRLPSSITQLQSLKSVSFYHNPDLDHASLFRQLAKLPHLEELNISETVDYQKDTLFHLPREIGMLKNLRKLEMENMYRVDYANLIEQIKDLPHLETLSLYNSNHYKKLLYDLKNYSLPASIKNLKNLKNLNVGRTNIGIFDDVETLPELTHLNCSDLALEPAFYRVVFNTTSLKSLNLNACEIKEFPEGILKLKELEHLDLGNNQISELPEAITQLKHLKYLNLMGTLISLSQEKRDKIEKMLPNTLVFFGEYRAYDPDWMDR